MVNLKTGVTRKQSLPNYSKNEHLLPSDRHTYMFVSEDINVRFFGIFVVLCFLATSVLRFAFLPYYRRIIDNIFCRNTFRGDIRLHGAKNPHTSIMSYEKPSQPAIRAWFWDS